MISVRIECLLALHQLGVVEIDDSRVQVETLCIIARRADGWRVHPLDASPALYAATDDELAQLVVRLMSPLDAPASRASAC